MERFTEVKRWTLVIGLAAFSALVFSACGSSSGSSSGSGGGGSVSKADLARYESELQALYKGTYEMPTGEPVKPPSGKDIWLITISQSIEPAQRVTAAMEEAASKLGWHTQIFDGKFESSRLITGIQQAIAAKADGIILWASDCAPVKSALEQAKAAEIPVVSIEGKPCEPKLSDYELTFAHRQPLEQWNTKEWAASQVKWIIAKTKGEPKTILTAETDAWTTQLDQTQIEEQFSECPSCEIVDTVTFTGTELGPPLQQKIEQALNEHPEANSMIASYDTVLTGGGGAAALRASGRLPEIAVAAGEGSVPVVELIRNQTGADSCSGVDFGMMGYAAISGMARLFAGQDPYKQNTGVGVQVCDKEHNLPPQGQPYTAGIDYVPAYEEMWGLK